jgi:hypothetical protein
MAIQYNENIKIAAPLSIDNRYLSLRTLSGSPLPYSGVSEVNTVIISSERYTGLTVNINNLEYWYKDGVTNTDLILKSITGGTTANAITGATNLGFFSGQTGVQTLPIDHQTNNTYDGDYLSLYNWFYRGTDGIIHTGAGSDNILKRGYVKSAYPTKSWVWNEYTASDGNLLGWILIDGNIANLIGQQVAVIGDAVYYTGATGVYTQTSWSGTPPTNGSHVTINTVTGSLTTGTTITIGGPPYSKEVDHVLEFRTVITDTPNSLGVSYDESFIRLSGVTYAYTGQNVGGGTGNVFKQKTGTTLQFRTIEGTGDTFVYQSGDRILISATGSVSGITTGVNVGNGVQVFKSKTGNTLQFRTFMGSGGTLVYQSGNTVVIHGGSGEGTVSGATNGLHLINSGTTVVLGGNLTSGTTINGQNAYELNLINLSGFHVSGGTTEIILVPTGITLSHLGTSVSLNSNAGLVYGGDYSTNFIDESLATKRYVDSIASGLKPKAAVKVATTIPIILSGLTQTIDTITPFLTGDRILVKNQVSGKTNGIYSASTSTWGRTADFDGSPSGEVVSGSYMWVLSGITNGNTAWVLNTPDPITVGTTPLNFVLFSHVADIVGGTGITVTMQSGIHTVSLNNATQNILAKSITGATNGLKTFGSHDVILGGNLTSGTTIYLCDNALRFKSDVANAYGLADFSLNSTYANSKFGICSRGAINCIWGLSGNSSSISAYHCVDGNNGSCFVINTGLTISSKVASASKSAIFDTKSFSYGGNYCSSNTSNPRWIPDKGYVDNQISGCSNILKVRIQGYSGPFIMTTSDDVVAVSGLTAGQLLCLPASPSIGQRIIVVDACGGALLSPICIDGYGSTINGGACASINTDMGSVTLVYIGYNRWSAIGFVN